MDMRSGVYRITNKVNGKFYIGSAKDIDQRWDCHRNDLRTGKHVNPKLQHAWDFYGGDKFLFEIVEETEPIQELLFERENHYLSMLKPYERDIGYNICPKAEGGDTFTHHPRGKEILQEWREKYSKLYVGEGNPMFGKKHSNRSIKQQREKSVGRYTLEWFVERHGKDEGEKKYQERRLMLMSRDINYVTDPKPSMSFRGHKHGDEFRRKTTQSKIYFRDHWSEFVELVKSNKYSQRQLSEMLEVSRQTIRQRIKQI